MPTPRPDPRAPRGAFFVGFGEGWIGSLFSRSNGNAIAETTAKP